MTNQTAKTFLNSAKEKWQAIPLKWKAPIFCVIAFIIAVIIL